MSKMDSYLCAIFRRIFRLFPINQRKVVFAATMEKATLTTPRPSRNRSWPGPTFKAGVAFAGSPGRHLPSPGIRPASYWGIHRAWGCLQLQSGWTIAGEENGASGKANTICKPGTALP